MSRSRRPALIVSMALATVAGCSAPSPSQSPQTTSSRADVAEKNLNADLHARTEASAQTLTAGFASVDMTWRVGAKPGQVGTDANVFQIALLWKQLGKLMLHAYHMQLNDHGNRVFQLDDYATEWSIKRLNQRFNQLRYDKYVDVFQPGRGVHTRAWAKAMVVENNGEKVAVVRADLYLMQKSIWRKVADLVAAETGLKPENILISATHNHSAADATFTAAGISTLADNFDPRHFVWVTHKLAEAIIEADKNRVPARMGAIHTRLRAVQRNIIGPATAEVIPPGQTDPVQVPAGYPRDFFDDNLYVLHFDNAQTGQRLGAYFVFGMHPESLDDGHGMLTSEFFGLTEMGLEERWGCPVIWAPGALGDIEPDDGSNFGTDFWREDFLTLEKQSEVLINAIGPVLEDAPLSTDQVLQPRGDIKVASAMHVFPGAPNEVYPGAHPWQIPVTEYISPDWPIACARALTESQNIMLQAFQLGDVLLMGSPSEITTDLSTHIRSRVDAVTSNIYQGYVWPGAPQWEIDQINQNFDNLELQAGEGFAMPIVLSQVNDYMGYMVTRWEFINRHHYRQEMTLYGQDTANYVAARFEGLARELRGAPAEEVPWDEISLYDIPLEDKVYGVVSDMEPFVAEFSKNIPPDDVLRMGHVYEAPTWHDTDEMYASSVHFGWDGPSSDMDIPRVAVDRALENGVWQEVSTDDSPHLWIMYTQKGKWEAIWHLVDPPGTGTYRFRVKGTYRSTRAGASTPDPIWDPEGKNDLYQVVSASFDVP